MQKLYCLLFIVSAFTADTISAQGTITSPRTPSPASSISQTIGISNVTVNYSRPSVKEREIWGKLVPYGWVSQGFGNGNKAPWRAGANENTVITFSHEGKLQGKTVPAGSYGLFFVIKEDNTGEVILSKDNRSWGSFWYVPEHDLFRAPIQSTTIGHTEILTYEFINLTKNSADLVLKWEKKQLLVKIEFAVDDIVIANAVEELKGPKGFNWQGYTSAANYALQNNGDLDLAMSWIDQAIATNNSFATLNIKAAILRKKGNMEEADKTMKAAVVLANENDLNNYGYQLLNQKDNDKAIEILALNTQRHPESANAFDSLGEAYAIKGDKKNAVKFFKKSLAMNPTPATRANSEKYLAELGAM